MITLIIKGNCFAAKDAARRKGVSISDLHPTGKGETLASASDEYASKVRDWYITDGDKAPFPDGTLLHYRHG